MRSVRPAIHVLRWAAATIVALSAGSAAGQSPPFEDVARRAGIDFVHFNGMSGETYFPEMMGAGAAWLDYDRDGDLDLYLVQGAMLGPEKTLEDATYPPRHQLPLSDRLYRNDSSGDRVRFHDVTEEIGLAAHGYGMGVSVGDVNNDGFPDLYLSNFGQNQLLVNDRGKRFVDRTAAAGVDDPRWSATASFFDYDLDGWQDLYLVNYVDYRWDNLKACRSAADQSEYCGPSSYNPETDRLFRNLGDGTFADVTLRAGIAGRPGAGLGSVSADFNADGWPDLFVANDGGNNFLWLNSGDGRFSEQGLLAGVAVNMAGLPEASMGVDAQDFDDDGDFDLFMTHLTRESNTLYVNDGRGWFSDQTVSFELAASSVAFTGFGTRWFDYDNDGDLDLYSANGAVLIIQAQRDAGEPLPLKQTNQLWRNEDGRFRDVSSSAGPAFRVSEASRGAAFGDFDSDGDLDIAVTSNAAPAQLLQNRVGQNRAWLGLELVAGDGVAVGAVARLRLGERTVTRLSRVDGSYASAHDPRILFGLGDRREPIAVEIRWPGGPTQNVPALAPNRYHRLERPAR